MPKTEPDKPKKKTAKASSGNWETKTFAIEYHGKTYKADIKGDLVLKTLTAEEIKDKLNELPGRFAFWKSIQESLILEIEEAEEAYDVWYAEAYEAASDSFDKKPTETAIKNRVMMTNTDEFRERQQHIRSLRQTAADTKTLVSAYENQIWTLRSIASLVEAELRTVEADIIRAKGKRNLNDTDV